MARVMYVHLVGLQLDAPNKEKKLATKMYAITDCGMVFSTKSQEVQALWAASGFQRLIKHRCNDRRTGFPNIDCNFRIVPESDIRPSDNVINVLQKDVRSNNNKMRFHYCAHYKEDTHVEAVNTHKLFAWSNWMLTQRNTPKPRRGNSVLVFTGSRRNPERATGYFAKIARSISRVPTERRRIELTHDIFNAHTWLHPGEVVCESTLEDIRSLSSLVQRAINRL